MDDNTRGDILVDNVPPSLDSPTTIIQEVIQAIKNLILPVNKDLVTYLKIPTPIKVTRAFTTDASGNIGRGLTTPDPVLLYSCPMSHEAWLHRITVTSPAATPANPLKTGEIICLGSTSGETIFFLPIAGNVAPVQIVEGRLSAPHLNSGETVSVIGDSLPANTQFKMDLQIVLVSGISEFTPRTQTQTQLDRL